VDIYTQSTMLSAVPKRSQRTKYSMMHSFSFLLPFRKGNGVSFAPFRT
jgi:hypothetical protein